MNDQSIMPFGKHRGEKMEDVPAAYLLWLWDDGVWNQPERGLHKYIKDAMPALLKECRDYIIQHPIK